MKIECDKCSAKYSIADEKVRGKTFKIRCKKCSNVIIVRDKGVVADSGGAAESGGPGWHLAINGETVGPMGEDEVRQRYAAGEIDKETAVWQEGFDDWLPLGEVDAFTDLPDRGAGGGAEDPFAASANQDDYAIGAARSPRMAAAAAVAATGTDGLAEPQSPRVSKLTGQRNENSVLFSLDSLQAMATSSASPARTNIAAPAARASSNPSKGLATAAPSSEGSGLIDIRSLGSMVGGSGGASAASAAPQGAADDAALPSFGGGGFGGLASTPLISPMAPVAEAAPAPVVMQKSSNLPLYIMMIVLILAVGGLGAYIVLKKPDEPKTIVQEVPIVAPTVKDDDEDDNKKDDDKKDDDEKKDDEKAEDDEGGTAGSEGGDGVAGDGSSGTKSTRKSGGGSSGGSKKSGGSSGSTGSTAGSTGSTGGTKAGGDSGSSSPSVDCILDPSKCGAPKKTGGSTGGSTSGGSTDPGAPEKLAASDIKAGMAGVKEAAKSCGPKHGAKPGEKVTVKLSFSGATGTVTKSTPQAPHAGTPLGNCVAGALKNAKVIKFKTASQGASYSVTM
jgi:predicted Zn finger-like uncharacterized protein